ncbi:MAG: hypothetical protein JWO94_3359 [Verrucomicrobiaceae bacterium]|nr:hypothetical protein [Verrucomicrobiaceae bacterium]
MKPPLTSCLYDCEVVHERLSPKRHGFRYRLFFMDLALDELPLLEKRLWLFSRNRRNFYGFQDTDHLDLSCGSTAANITRHLADNGVSLPKGARIRLVTLPRVLGYIFNPVCFYFFFDKAGTPLHAVAEVTNTFHEMKPYLIPEPDEKGVFNLTTPKHFYVSPFSGLDTSFHFQLGVPGEKIKIHIDDLEDGQKTLMSWIHGERRELTDARLLWYLVRFPALTVMVIGRIHWQAFRLWLKKLPFHRKSASPELQRGLFRPHAPFTEPTKP